MSHTIKLFNIITRGNVRYNYSVLKHICNYSKDITRAPLPTSATPPDYLIQNLKNATTTQNVLDIVGAHYKIMNSKQLLQALRTMFTLQKFGNSNISTQQIIKHPDFEKLCHCLKSQAGMIELNETLEALKIISFVGVSSHSTIVQVLLQLLRHNVNDLSISNLMFLDFLLRQFKSSPLVDGLLIALPVVFEVNLPVKMDRENIVHITECLQFASKRNVSEKCIKLIVNSLIKVIDLHGELNAKTASSILWSICDMEPNEYFVPLYKKAINGILTDGLDKLNSNDVVTVLSKIAYKTSPKFLHYYDDIFYDCCAHYIIDNNLGFEEAIFTLLKFSRVSHTNDNLLNYICKKYEENPRVLMDPKPIHIFSLGIGIAQSEYKPIDWPVIKKIIQETNCFAKCEIKDFVWLKLAASLCALDIYQQVVLKNALSLGYVNHILNHGKFADDYENFLLILQAINTFKPEFYHLLPENSVIETVASKVKPVFDYPLEGVLQKALGGENYVNTCLKTRLHHHIDHVIIMRKGAFPIPLPKNHRYIEDIEIPTDGYMILVLALQQSHYTINTKRLKATSVLMIKTLEAKGYNVVPICMDVWEQLADFERIPFIMQAIKLKIETQMEMSSVL